MSTFHPLNSSLLPPTQLNNPFDYEPHPLCRIAADEVCQYLEFSALNDEVKKGKMLGVLVCRDSEGQVGFLAAYSGQIGGREDWPWFVPAVFDYLQPNGYFKQEEARISSINSTIAQKEADDHYTELKQQLTNKREEAERNINSYRHFMAQAKTQRDAQRAAFSSPNSPSRPSSLCPQEVLIHESQHQKAELRRLKEHWRKTIAAIEEQLLPLQQEIETLRQQRRQRSDALQRWLFDHFVMLNDRGESRTLTDIFVSTPQHTPPAGAGECCAPKLLQYAFLNHFEPLAIAEFWQGESPRMEVRHHGRFYPACTGKCKPILEWMIKSLTPDHSPKERGVVSLVAVITNERTIYSPLLGRGVGGEALVLTKPAGLLSVPGRTGEPSVQSMLEEEFGQVYMVHRLDQDTSGIMVVALTLNAYHNLQRQFAERKVKKKYIALICGEVHGKGTISLPLRPDPMDRPRQVVDYEHGKEAVTDYEVLEVKNGFTRIALTPHTGRTHQLRMHCAHKQGLDAPILGDRLYGADTQLTSGIKLAKRRLYLHACQISFCHPFTGELLTFNSPAPF